MTELDWIVFLDWVAAFIEATGYTPTQAEIREYKKMYYETIEDETIEE